MLDIENFNWSDLHDAYGKASAIPNLIKSVTDKINSSENSQSGPWFELWSRLCHQGTIYDASCAAVPYIVAAIPNRKTSINMNFFSFAYVH